MNPPPLNNTLVVIVVGSGDDVAVEVTVSAVERAAAFVVAGDAASAVK